MKNRIVIAGLTMALVVFNSVPAFARSWRQDRAGWRWLEDDGSYPVSTWKEIDGKQYYFDSEGYMLSNTVTPDGYLVDINGVYLRKSSIPGDKYSDGTYSINPAIFEDMNTPTGQLLEIYPTESNLLYVYPSAVMGAVNHDEMELDITGAPFTEYIGSTKFEKGEYFPEYDLNGDGKNDHNEIGQFFYVETQEYSDMWLRCDDKYVLDRGKPPYMIRGNILSGFTNGSYPVEEIGRFAERIGATNIEVVNRNTQYEGTEVVFMDGTFYTKRTGEMKTGNVTSISFELDGLKFSAKGEWGKIYPMSTEWTVTR